jgi:glutathione S-transferase
MKPESGLTPANGSRARVRLQEWLNFITSEIHAGSAPLFNAALPEDARQIIHEKLFRRFAYLETSLSTTDYLTGRAFSVADAYLFTVLGWCALFRLTYTVGLRWQPLWCGLKGGSSVQAALRAEAAQ